MENSTADTDATEQLNTFLNKHHSVRYVLLQWVDYSAVQHAQIIPLHVARRLASGELNSFTIAESCMIVPISTAPRFFPKGPETWELHPDWSSLRLCWFRPSHASIMCFTYQAGASCPSATCPRTLLKKAVQIFESQHSTALLIGFEAEFVLLDETLKPPMTRLNSVLGHSTISGLRSERLEMLEEMVDAMELIGIPVRKLHTEGVDSFEIAMDPKSPMAAVDSLMYAHETIRTISVKWGLKATFAIQPQLDGAINARNGSHLHLSLNPSPEADSFLAGILYKMTSLCAIGMANWDS